MARSQEQISFLVDETLSAKVRSERVDTEIAEAIASLLAPSLIMMIVTLLAHSLGHQLDHPPAQPIAAAAGKALCR